MNNQNTMTTPIDTTHWPKHPTKSGWLLKNKRGEDVRIVCVDAGSDYPLMSDVGNRWTYEGYFYDDWTPSTSDLIIPTTDPYAELRAAHKDGKVIEMSHVLDGKTIWEVVPDPAFQAPASRYRIKPEWTLGRSVNGFTLADGQEWHRQDWTEDMLPEGWRPHILGEINNGDDWYFDEGEWIAFGAKLTGTTKELDLHIRTRRPLPPVKKMVPLGPEDVPPGSIIRRRDEAKSQSWHWRLLSYVLGTGSVCGNLSYTWEELARDYEINRNDGKGWVACEKEEAK